MAKGYHVNSDKPLEKHLIPMKFVLTPAPLALVSVVYPKAHEATYQFQKQPLSVVTGPFDVVATVKAPAGGAKGTYKLPGTLRYQACTETLCLPPRTIQFTIPVIVR
jgi:hypothetical protein